MKLNILSVLFLLLLCTSSCREKQCEARKTGEQTLNTESEKFAPYSNEEILLFTSNEGESLRFTVERQESFTDRMCVKYLCETFSDPFQQIPCEYYEGESIRNILRADNDTLLIDILVSINNYEEESTLFYDQLKLSFSGIGSLAQGGALLHAHFDTPELDPEKLNFLEPLEFVESLEINGQTFTDLYQTTNGNNVIYYQKDQGILALKYQNEIYLKEG